MQWDTGTYDTYTVIPNSLGPVDLYSLIGINSIIWRWRLEVHLHVMELRRDEELDSAFAAMAQARADALLVVEDALLLSRLRGRTVDLAATHRLPAMYDRRQIVEAGGLMSYGRNLGRIQQRYVKLHSFLKNTARSRSYKTPWVCNACTQCTGDREVKGNVTA
jgi:hypothetical protein